MNAFLSKHKYNYIKKKLTSLQKDLKFLADPSVIGANKLIMKDDIELLMAHLEEEELSQLNIQEINGPEDVDIFLKKIEPLTKGMTIPSMATIKKLFKKEKKLKLPSPKDTEGKFVYLGWFDEATKRIYFVYDNGEEIKAMVCRVQIESSSKSRICKLCHRVGLQDDIVFVSPICKSSQSEYRSIGFSVCRDSKKCNEYMTSTESLTNILEDVLR